jgi:hypothetical protein
MTIAKDMLRLAKRLTRRERNRATKIPKAKVRQEFLALLGKTLVEKEVPVLDEETGLPTEKTEKHYDFPPFIKMSADGTPLPFKGQQQNPPQLSWLNGKTFKQSAGGRKNRSGQKELHTEALLESANRLERKLTPSVN